MRTLVLFVAGALLQGCATCAPESFLKPAIQLPDRTIAPWSGDKEFSYSLSSDLEIGLYGCREDTLCISLNPDAGTTVRLTRSSYELVMDGAAERHTQALGSIRFSVVFIADKKGEVFVPDSDPAIGFTSPLSEIETSRNRFAFTRQYSFKSDEAFVGVESKTRFFTLVRRLRTYSLSIQVPHQATEGAKILLPDVEVNGRRVAIPPIRIKNVTESICHRPTG